MTLPSLTNILNFFEQTLSAGRGALLGDVKDIASLLVTFEVVFAGIYLVLGSSADIRAIARKVLTIGFFFYVIEHYAEILRFVVDGFLFAGQKAGSGAAVDFATLRDPAKVFIKGMQIAKPVADKLFANIDASYFGIPSSDSLMLLFCLILTVFSFAIMAIQVFITYLEFLLVATAGFIIIPFGIFKPTAFLAERVFGAIISFGVKLMILALTIGVSEAFLRTISVPAEVSWNTSVELSVIALALAFLSLHAPGVAQSLLSGSPHLSFGSLASTAAASGFVASRAASSVVSGGSSISSGTLKAAGAIHGGGSVAAASMGSVGEAGGFTGKAARMASKSAMYATGGVGGAVAGAASEAFGKIAFGSAGSPSGQKAYREKIGDSSLSSNGRGGRQGSGGVVGSFNTGRYSVPQYRATDEKKRKEKAQGEDAKVKKEAKEENSNTKGETSGKEEKK